MNEETDNDYERRVTNLFVSVMGIVRDRRRLNRKQDDLQRDIERSHVDKRIVDCLENEYERSLEESGYKMRSVSWIREDIRRVDNGEETQFWEG
jgi:hypothetical protein